MKIQPNMKIQSNIRVFKVKLQQKCQTGPRSRWQQVRSDIIQKERWRWEENAMRKQGHIGWGGMAPV
jgi:L,D-peptidoglycan transpeptidase YkuD (ErfK/YbiS/YcfS/YnhG family)